MSTRSTLSVHREKTELLRLIFSGRRKIIRECWFRSALVVVVRLIFFYLKKRTNNSSAPIYLQVCRVQKKSVEMTAKASNVCTNIPGGIMLALSGEGLTTSRERATNPLVRCVAEAKSELKNLSAHCAIIHKRFVSFTKKQRSKWVVSLGIFLIVNSHCILMLSGWCGSNEMPPFRYLIRERTNRIARWLTALIFFSSGKSRRSIDHFVASRSLLWSDSMANSSRILLPFALWPEHPPSLAVSSLYLNPFGDDLITGTQDGFIICWKIVADRQKVGSFSGMSLLRTGVHTLDHSEVDAYRSHQPGVVYRCTNVYS